MNIDQKYIDFFEKNLNPVEPEKSDLPFEILGFGEISSIFKMEEYPDIVFKRLPVFPDLKSAKAYRDQYIQYCRHLKNSGISLPDDGVFITHITGRPYVLYLAQHLFSADILCSHLIHTLDQPQIIEMLEEVLKAVNKIRLFNENNMPELEIAVDAQLSNWTWPIENGKRKLYLIDTSTPFYRVSGLEQLDVKLLLKSMPFVIRLFINLINLDDVVARYYDLRTVFLDIIGNLIKEQAPELIPLFINIVNKNINSKYKIEPVTKKDAVSYYQKDKMIWRVFSTLRRIDRFVSVKILRKHYEFLLPGKVKR